MSQIVTMRTEIRDSEALRLDCDRLQLKRPVHWTAKLFSTKATSYCVELPDWRYSVVCDVESDRVHFNNFNGRWGKQRELYRLLQAFSIDKDATGIETVRAHGHRAIAQHQVRSMRRRGLVRRLQLQF